MILGVSEVWFRTVMPACQSPTYYQDSQWDIRRQDPTGPREGLETVGRLTVREGHWHVNNDGWISAVDYVPADQRSRPLVALFGDSFVEGLATDVGDHVDAKLAGLLNPTGDVYSFGVGGWYLEQYVAVSRYVSSAYGPDVLVILLDVNDVVDSRQEYGVVSPYLWQVASGPAGFQEVRPAERYVASRLAAPARRSALLNYLRYNAKVALPGMKSASVPEDAKTERGTTSTAGTADEWREQLPAATCMVRQLVQDHPGAPIVFAAHGDRYIPLESLSDTPLFPDARAVQAACEGEPDCYFLDLRESFSRDWAANHVSFEAADGVHWNAHGNEVVARALASFIEERGLLGPASRPNKA